MEAVQGLWLCIPKATRAATTLGSLCTHPAQRKQSCPSQPCLSYVEFYSGLQEYETEREPCTTTSSQAACHLFVAALKASFYLLILYMHLFLCPRVSLKWLIWWSVLSLLKEGTFSPAHGVSPSVCSSVQDSSRAVEDHPCLNCS